MPSNNSPQQSYIKSGVWKCQTSPSGAHHWVEKRESSAVYGTFRCLHCDKEDGPITANPMHRSRQPF